MLTPDFIKDYLLQKFQDEPRFSSDGEEMMLNSPFVEDERYHFSINVNSGLWQCFKSGNRGNFTQLYSHLEGITYRQAEIRICLKTLDKAPASIDYKKYKHYVAEQSEEHNFLPVTLESFDSVDKLVQDAWFALYHRGLFNLKNPKDKIYYVAFDGRYKNRIIIPYMENKKMFFLQGRALYNDLKPKYLNPTGDNMLKSGDVLYPFDRNTDHLVICEGPLDAISLQIQGVNATCINGCKITDNQLDQLRKFPGIIIAGFDNDHAGEAGIKHLERLRKKRMMSQISVCFCDKNSKDWNDMHVKGINLREYVKKNSTTYDEVEFKVKEFLES